MAKRQVFYSFHYIPDNWRVSQVRNIGVVEGNKPVSDNDWEDVTKGGDNAIQKWIDDNLRYRSCTVVLVGEKTAGRKWINYEIEKSWVEGKGVVGIHIHGLENSKGEQAHKGKNPFDYVKVDGKALSSIVKCYDTPYVSSKYVYECIQENLEKWIEEAIKIRSVY
jgi:hypothetical protein